MKKVLSMIVACVLLVSVFAVSAAAATPKEEIMAAAKEALLHQHHEEILPMIENVLNQVDVSADQAAQVIKHIKAAEAGVKEHEGNSLSEYSEAEQAHVLGEVKAAAAVLGLTAVVEPSADPKHPGDIVFDAYNDAGKLVASVDLDNVVRQNNVAVDYTMAVVAALFLAIAAVAAVYGKKLVASR